jgi:hypothetical protein
MEEIKSPQFEEERRAVRRHLKDWLNRNPDGGFVVVSGPAVLGPYRKEEVAMKIASEVFRDGQYLVRSIEDESIPTHYHLAPGVNRPIPSEPEVYISVGRGIEIIKSPRYL